METVNVDAFFVFKSSNLYGGREAEYIPDLRDPATTPLNFTKSINLALSERGIHSMLQAHCEGLLEDVLAETIPMHARMIHGRRKNGEIYEESQQYDVHGRVKSYPY